MEARPVVLVEWIDPCDPAPGGWLPAEELVSGYAVCHTVGFLWSGDAEKICIVSSVNDADQLDHATTIPRVCVRSIVTLRNGPSHRVTRRRGT